MGPILLSLALATLAYGASKPAPKTHEEWHPLLRDGADMRIERAGFFGAGGVEAFSGVCVLPGGEIAAYGNSWGAPFPEDPKPSVLGDDHPVDLPLFPGGFDKDGKGLPLPPPRLHPNRTGFIVRYAPDLGRIASVMRFGWGVATIDAGLAGKDGGMVVAGAASAHFDAIAGDAKAKRVPAPNDPIRCFGPLLFETARLAGNVYVGRLNAKQTGFEWLWVLEGYRVPPSAIHPAPDGSMVFECNYELFRVAADGSTCASLGVLTTPARGATLSLAGVRPDNGQLVVAGGRMYSHAYEAHLGTRFSSVVEPVLDMLAPDGKLASRLYHWPTSLTANRRINLRTSCSIVAACVFPDGALAFAGQARGTNTLLETNPADLTQRCRPGGFQLNPAYNPSPWAPPPPAALQLVVTTPGEWSKGVRAPWVAMDGILPAQVAARGMLGMRDGRLALWGESGRWLLQTETNVFRAYDHVKYLSQDFSRSVPEMQASGRPKILAVGGEGPYLTVFDRDLAGLAWSSALPGCRVAGAVETDRGLAVVSMCVPDSIPKYAETPPGMENRPPAMNTPWTKFGGGLSDGHILLLGGAK
jgi:hypothetical protein